MEESDLIIAILMNRTTSLALQGDSGTLPAVYIDLLAAFLDNPFPLVGFFRRECSGRAGENRLERAHPSTQKAKQKPKRRSHAYAGMRSECFSRGSAFMDFHNFFWAMRNS